MKTVSEEQAAARLFAGGVGVLPTDTIYGIVARAADKQAVAKLYRLKRREHKPGTVIAASVEQLIVLGLDEQTVRAISHLWPNSLSIIIKADPSLSYLDQGLGDLAVRVPKDQRVHDLLARTGPLVTSSANHPGKTPASTVAEAQTYFGDQVDFYVDGGDLSGRPSSTIVRATEEGLELIREGAVVIPPEELVGIAK